MTRLYKVWIDGYRKFWKWLLSPRSKHLSPEEKDELVEALHRAREMMQRSEKLLRKLDQKE